MNKANFTWRAFMAIFLLNAFMVFMAPENVSGQAIISTKTIKNVKVNALALDSNRKIYVATYNDTMLVMDTVGKILHTFGDSGSGFGQVNYPTGIAVGKNGKVYVADGQNNRVNMYNDTGKYIDSFYNWNAAFVAVNDKDWCYTVSTNNQYVSVNDSTKKFIFGFGGQGYGGGQFQSPNGIAIGKNDMVSVVNYYPNQIKVFTDSGQIADSFHYQTGNPYAIAIDKQYRTFVGSPVHNSITVYDSLNDSLFTFGGTGTGTDSFKTLVGIAVDSDGTVYAADQGNNRIQIIRFRPWAFTGNSRQICSGQSTMLGTKADTLHTYSWTSIPAGFTGTTSNPMVSPTITTTYTLVEKVPSTGYSNRNSIVITVNPLPKANTGSVNSVCMGSTATIGDTEVSSSKYSWASNPSGFASSISNPSVSPTIVTTYYLTETDTLTGCHKSDSLVVIVNPLPTTSAGSPSTICAGSPLAIGSTRDSLNTYSWKSNPTGFSDTAAIPVVNPTITTTYYLTVSIRSTGCSKSDSVVITVNPAPAANTSGAQSICIGNQTSIGAKAIANSKYSWKSNPTGFSDDSTSSSIVKPTVTTTYYLTETDTLTHCFKSDSAVITVNGLPVVSPGSNQNVSANKPTFLLTGFSPAGGKWTGKGVDSAGNFNPSKAGTGIDTLTYTFTNISGCTASATKAINVTPGNATIDAGIDEILSPVGGRLVHDNYPVIVHLLNYGSATLTSVDVHWEVNNVAQPVYSWLGSLGMDSSSLITLSAGYNFSSIGQYTVKAWTENPDSSTDGNHANDTTSVSFSIFRVGIQPSSSGNANVKMWYNANDEKVHVQINAEGSSQVALQLTDMQGKILSNGNISLRTGLNETTIDVSSYPSGIYLCIVQGNVIVDRKEIIKMK